MSMFRRTLRFLLSALSGFVLASIFHSQFVLAELSALGTSVPMKERLSMTLQDIAGLLPGYGSVIVVALLLGFLLMRSAQRWIPLSDMWGYPLAGFLAMAAALTAMQPLLDVTLIAGARSAAGFLCQSLAGASAGLMFIWLKRFTVFRQ